MTALVAVLAGGRGRRMGAPKATVELGGRPLVAWPLAAAQEAGLEAVVVAKAPLEVGAAVWLEPAEPVHPLLGVVTALDRAVRPVVAVACDMPFVSPALLARLAAGPEAAVRVEGEIQPLPARFEPAALAALRRAVSEGRSVRSTLAALGPATIEANPHELRSLNTPADLAAAREAVAGGDRSAAGGGR